MVLLCFGCKGNNEETDYLVKINAKLNFENETLTNQNSKLEEKIKIQNEELLSYKHQIEELKDYYTKILNDNLITLELDNNLFTFSNFYKNFENEIITNYEIKMPVYKNYIPTEIIGTSIEDSYYNKVGLYQNPKSFNESNLYSNFFGIDQKDFEWGNGFIYGEQDKEILYNSKEGKFFYKDTFVGSFDNTGIVTSDLIKTNGPSVNNPLYLDVYRLKIEDNKAYMDYFNHDLRNNDVILYFVREFFGRLSIKDFNGLKPFISESKGLILGEIENFDINDDFYSIEKFFLDIENVNSSLYKDLVYYSESINQHHDLKFDVLYNSFYSEDIKMIYKQFGDKANLFECKINPKNYVSFVLLEENGIYKISYLNVNLLMR